MTMRSDAECVAKTLHSTVLVEGISKTLFRLLCRGRKRGYFVGCCCFARSLSVVNPLRVFWVILKSPPRKETGSWRQFRDDLVHGFLGRIESEVRSSTRRLNTIGVLDVRGTRFGLNAIVIIVVRRTSNLRLNAFGIRLDLFRRRFFIWFRFFLHGFRQTNSMPSPKVPCIIILRAASFLIARSGGRKIHSQRGYTKHLRFSLLIVFAKRKLHKRN
mmetsp:Transcript_16238/g.32908  ORF Transcript_16238/g.32908 Transcript_16238/m.32908 type:complete len:216 (+) Transcript_16238:715-1362(+)